ncbi:EmrA/EmrK family multidrug efflux transporter periplasmic adaptor subunit [Pasteurella atlantica]|uniref:EmrA/EmrK family multidrug efflux transporter periplasmic adaptor subunit n=2 Tax=Pasteurellaceae TaxID=712 RepID=A0ACC6HJ73_9PAST|nr:EmrA/EmrK family multidrug efflux transporter periplasmic adaptor subunit [Pasteurella atlantica]MDP8050924.1 EmrA/EmrK family multidrug efflux transporter periplasmic adaptor subunit [Pasteurella atlantica]MDP8104194.1 EmrA/EmrK family multidrug efflux transporter periplasmic adaptor subunit [Pasteurella atlantica]MDP8147580.1 EmrA/EmrK family multidrug efflux transporter periplasmic adaptor subunit [Pasteurella atlantica]
MSETGSDLSKKKQRTKAFSLFFGLLFIIIVIVSICWLFFFKGYETTDDAYVVGNQVMITPKVAGNVVQINVENMDFVHKGDVLVVLDNSDKKLALKQAETALASAVRNIQQLNYSVKQLQETVKGKQIALAQAKSDLARRQKLAKTHSIDQESVQHAKDKMTMAYANLQLAKLQLASSKALLQQMPLIEQPTIQNAIASVKQAWLKLKRTQILSPVEGYVAKRNVQLGASVGTNSPLMAIIPPYQFWIDANFKETQLKNIRIGQPVKVTVDMYGDDIEFDGKVTGIALGTGSAFSLLPAQNATGNWIKITQRVPVRIELDPQQLEKYPLRMGLSASVKIEVTNKDGDVLLQQKRSTPLYTTDALGYDQTEIEQRISHIIKQNINEH